MSVWMADEHHKDKDDKNGIITKVWQVEVWAPKLEEYITI